MLNLSLQRTSASCAGWFTEFKRYAHSNMTKLVTETRNINIHYDLPHELLEVIPSIYKAMEGWLGFGDGINGDEGIPYWFSFDETKPSISASIEPSGLQFLVKNMEEDEWNLWRSQFKRKATEILRFKVGEIETGEVGYEIEWLS